MAFQEEDILRDTLRSFRSKELEPAWEQLDAPEAGRFEALWHTLSELGVTAFGLDEARGGMDLTADSRLCIAAELGAACPALGVAVIGHTAAQRLLCAAGDGAVTDTRLALCTSPLDTQPDARLTLQRDASGGLHLHGSLRMVWAYPQQLVVPALLEGAPRLCVLPVETPGVDFVATPSSHGLCLLQFGSLSLRDVALSEQQVLPWPETTAIAREADALLSALMAGMTAELFAQAGEYALQRYQGGKMIHEHDAVRQLVGPIEVARRAIDAFARATLMGDGPADAACSAFAVELTRQAGLDAIQTFGGYGYMEDYRVERYLRDAGTLETMWIHADTRRRHVAADCFAAMAS